MLRYTARALCACAQDARPDAARWLIRALKQLALAELLAPRAQEKQGRAEAMYMRLRRWMENNLHADIGRESAATVFGITPAYVSRLFRHHAHSTFTECMTDLRLDFAETLLTATDLKVYQVATQCGFRSPAYFVKRFRERHGTTPGNYRRQRATVA